MWGVDSECWEVGGGEACGYCVRVFCGRLLGCKHLGVFGIGGFVCVFGGRLCVPRACVPVLGVSVCVWSEWA